MGYSNYSKLKVIKVPVFERIGTICSICEENYSKESVFCSKDGNKLSPSKILEPITNIIELFRGFSDNAAHLINNDGSSEESSSNTIVEDLIKFSKNYPDGVFEVDIDWDQGFGEPPSRYYVMNGRKQDCKLTMIFDKFDEKKLK